MTSSVLTNAALHPNISKRKKMKKTAISPDLRMNFTKKNSVAIEPKSTVS